MTAVKCRQRSEVNLSESILSFHHTGLRTQTPFVSLGSRCPDHLCPLAVSRTYFSYLTLYPEHLLSKGEFKYWSIFQDAILKTILSSYTCSIVYESTPYALHFCGKARERMHMGTSEDLARGGLRGWDSAGPLLPRDHPQVRGQRNSLVWLTQGFWEKQTAGRLMEMCLCTHLSTEGSQASPVGTLHQQMPPATLTATSFSFSGSSWLFAWL